MLILDHNYQIFMVVSRDINYNWIINNRAAVKTSPGHSPTHAINKRKHSAAPFAHPQTQLIKQTPSARTKIDERLE